jgi:hypothetical protein
MTKAMWEEEMDNVHELDGCDEAEGQRLLTAAFDTVPVGTAPAAELLRQVRRHDKTRRRVRTLVPAGAVAALGGAAAAAVTLTATVATAPSAFAAVTAAAAKTSAESFHVTVQQSTVVGSSSGARSSVRVVGDFAPSRGLGEETASSGPVSQVRYLGKYVYARVPKTNPLGHGKPWVESLNVGLGYDPGTFLAQLEKAGTVTDKGPASGPGWTGTKYAFVIRAAKNGPVADSGTVYVDKHGLVRHLVMTTTLRPVPGEPWEQFTDDVTFGDFGVSVLVPAPPPASQVYNYGKLGLGYFPI